MELSRYFDYAATSPLDSRVREAMLPFLNDAFGNANSIHSLGLRARDAVERAREQVATLIGADDPMQVYFTSGATESNNWALQSGSHIAISPFEHSAMREPALRKGASVIPNNGPELLPLEHRGADLISVMAVNNETGLRWNPDQFSSLGTTLHCDATQALGKQHFDIGELDLVSGSAHKLYGPKGVGFLYCRDNPPEPLILGGEQEHGSRGGTLNVAAIVGFGAAAEIALDEIDRDIRRAEECRAEILDGLQGLSGYKVNQSSNNSPYILSISFEGVEGESLVLEMDSAGYAISSGAACSSRSTEPSHVLTALGVPPELIRGTIRISFGKFSVLYECCNLAEKLRSAVEKFRTLRE